MAERTVQISMIAVILFAIGLTPASVSAAAPRKSKFAPTRTGPTFLWFPNGPVLIIPPWITLQKTGPLVSLTKFGPPFVGTVFPEAIQLGRSADEVKRQFRVNPISPLDPQKPLANPFVGNDMTSRFSLFRDRLTISTMWQNTLDGCLRGVLPLRIDRSPFLICDPSFCVSSHLFFTTNRTVSPVDLLVCSNQRTDDINVFQQNVPRSFSHIDETLRQLASKIGKWKNDDSRIEWMFYEIGETTWTIAVDSQTAEVRIFAESSLPEWPKEIAISFDMFSMEATQPKPIEKIVFFQNNGQRTTDQGQLANP
ncbi:MAG: hypothetical protein IID45_03430 [Planctomycetes bacterium]|nr:hypothetical protein [Planctomycetota bacterium]